MRRPVSTVSPVLVMLHDAISQRQAPALPSMR
jgi:hypothetical protein